MTLSEIIERLEKAEDFDREADREIGRLLLGWTVTDAYIETDERDVYPNHPGALYPTFTESLETAISLVEKVMPGWCWLVRNDEEAGAGAFANVTLRDGVYEDGVDAFPVWAKTPALALVTSLLKAKQMGVGE